MKRIFVLLAILAFLQDLASAQTATDTLHYRKIYYMGGTGLSFPIGRTSKALKTNLFSGSAGLDIALKNRSYFLMPTLYMLNFGYKQQIKDPAYNSMVDNGKASFYLLSLAAGKRKQFKRLNTYSYVGPAFGLQTEPRADVVGDMVKMKNKKSWTLAGKIGLGADYKFPGFFIGGELGYLYSVRKIEGNPVQFLTIMIGLKSDITGLSKKVTDVIGVETYEIDKH
ncbi:MAG: hypothetical protein ACTJHT_16305 [Sphingobacterium sp.]